MYYQGISTELDEPTDEPCTPTRIKIFCTEYVRIRICLCIFPTVFYIFPIFSIIFFIFFIFSVTLTDSHTDTAHSSLYLLYHRSVTNREASNMREGETKSETVRFLSLPLSLHLLLPFRFFLLIVIASVVITVSVWESVNITENTKNMTENMENMQNSVGSMYILTYSLEMITESINSSEHAEFIGKFIQLSGYALCIILVVFLL